MRTLGALLLLLGVVAAQEYAFRGMEIYKLDYQIRNPIPCDVDGDGLNDLLIANNDKAKIEVFLRRKEKVPPKKTVAVKLPNDLLDDQYFERTEVLTEKQVWSMVAGDLNGDGKLDIAYYGKPEELVVVYGDGKGGFPESRAFDITDGAASSAGLAIGDLTGDGRADLVLLGKTYTAILRQSEKGVLEEPVKLPHAAKGIHAVLIEDLDGDRRADLVLLNSGSSRGVRVRFQRPDGSLGAESMFATTPWRDFGLEDIDPSPGAEVLVVQASSGVLRALRMRRKAKSDLLGAVEIFSFAEARGGKTRSMALGDVNGDGRADLVVNEPGTAQVALYLQDQQLGLSGRRLFPSLSNSEAVRVADLDGDGRGEVIVISGAEKAVGITKWKEERLPFPELLDLPGTPRAIDAGDLNGDGRADLAVVVEPEKKKWQVLTFLQGEKGELLEPRVQALEGLKQAPTDLLILDIDQDGVADLVLFDKYDSARVLRKGTEDLSKLGTKYRGGLVSKLSRDAANVADIDGDGKPELFVASKNFLRAIVCDANGSLKVKDQANGATPRSQVEAGTALDLDGDGVAEVALYDKDGKAVTVLKREGGVFVVAANLPVGDLDFVAMDTADLNGDGVMDLVLMGKNSFGVMLARGRDQEFTELHKIESTARNALLGEFAVGDLNGDGKLDVAVLDRRRAVQIFSYDPEKGFVEKARWDIYEKKMHDERRKEGGAHSLVIEDFDGDGKKDLALLVHDRLIVYPQ